MRSVTVAAVSMDGLQGQMEKILQEVDTYTRSAVEQGAELVLFPEVLIHGHCTPNTWELAESVPDGPSVRRLCEIARKYNTVLSVGLSEKEQDIVYNTQVLVGPAGYIGKQRKLHMSRDESLFYKGGRELPVFDLGFCKVGTVICYDNTFPEPARVLAIRGAELLLMPHAARFRNWADSAESEREARQFAAHYYETMIPCRARENATFCLVADQAGRAGYVSRYPRESPLQPHHPGGAFAFDPKGEIVAQTQRERVVPEMIIARLAAAVINEVRSDANFTLRTRRPELFGDLLLDPVRS